MAIDEVAASAPTPIDRATLDSAREITESVRTGGEAALRSHAERLDGLAPGAPMVLGKEELARAAASVPEETLALLERVAGRIRAFALAQRGALTALEVAVPGGRAGHDVEPVAAAGCYAPGGRYPLPSSVLMTAVTARAGGVERVIVASPAPDPVTLAAAHVARADQFLCVGGAQAVAAMSYGVPGLVEPVALVVGPGNRWVTAAKQIVYGAVGIDLPAGPSELVVLADETANPDLIAADLLAQAEHDPDARPALITTDPTLPDRVETCLMRRLGELPTREVASAALAHGFVAVADSMEAALKAVDELAPEHLQLCVGDPRSAKASLKHFGAAFLGERSAEVFGDYGAGPNHVLPTGGAARYSGGLSVFTFLRVRTWLELDSVKETGEDARDLAELERLSGHARAAEARLGSS
ncbi:Histidinol dehydrogenase [Planctomycetes bacterium Poly30]|uniref:Histidinol dehydrogenase n=1 Tax=Saltatorellus ferox TaxID=2528018 RepID=A0A518EPH8_9BACT|nr:Histidinol dehydrogenase [Planctomycetes bacterium Poly30]